MIKIVREFLDKYNINSKTIIVAFSAGPDSCALARILNDLKQDYNLKIVLAYFNHMWRCEAYEEEEFTENFAKKYNLNYFIKRADKNISLSEENARDLRYRFLYDAACQYKTNCVFLAHNKNDNVETLVYRVIKGTSPKGLCSIPERRDIFYRPLLKVEKKEILKYLKTIQQDYKIDSSNDDTIYKRNFIRNKILPLFNEINPNFINNIDNLIVNSINSSKIINDVILNIMNKIVKGGIIDRFEYLNLGSEYRYEILNSYLGDKLKYRDYKTIKKLDNFIVNNPYSRTSLNKNEFLRTRKNKIFIENRENK